MYTIVNSSKIKVNNNANGWIESDMQAMPVIGTKAYLTTARANGCLCKQFAKVGENLQ